jgi:predicted flap endonuclease-1-like 5' DNA nuclease
MPPLRIRLDKQTTDEVPSFLQRPSTTQTSEDLTAVKGIGPTFAARLQEAGIRSVAGVTAVSVKNLAEILQISETRAATILAEVKKQP